MSLLRDRMSRDMERAGLAPLTRKEYIAAIRHMNEFLGLPPEELEQVFIPFYRTKAAQDRAVSGVGLGLSIARAVARAHGGDVVLRSEGAGLSAEVVLPLAR